MKSIFNDPTFHLRPNGQKLEWFGNDNLKKYDPTNNLYGPNDIEYTFNKHGFRCDDFTESDVRIVFLGCSFTEGIGLPYTKVWAYQILTMIREDTGLHIPYWNLAMGGCGLDATIRAYYHYHDMLKPHIVFALLPSYRREIFIPENSSNVPIFTTPFDDMLTRHDILLDPRTIQYETEKNLAMLDLMLIKHDTMMIWNSWAYDDHYPKDYHCRHDMMINFDCKARDKMHAGPDANRKFADEIYFKFREKILSKIKSISCDGP